MRKYGLVWTMFLILSLPAHGQVSTGLLIQPGDHQVRQINTVYELYADSLDPWLEMINGREYEDYFYPLYTNPLLRPNEDHSAFLVMRGKKYEELFLQYDTYLDEVIYRDKNRVINNKLYKIVLNKNFIDAFTLEFKDDILRFRFMDFSSSENATLKSGYYEMVYDGDSQFFIKHQSYLTKFGGRDLYKYSPVKYFRINNANYRVKSNRRLIRLFGMHSREIRRYQKSQHIFLRDANKYQIAALIMYYDSLKEP